MKAWIENNIIRDIAHAEPFYIYHPDIAKFYDTDVPDNAENGDLFVDGILTKPEPVVIEPIAPVKVITYEQIRAHLTFSEKVAWDNDTSPEIKTAKIELTRYGLTKDEAQSIVDILINKGALFQDSGLKVLELYL